MLAPLGEPANGREAGEARIPVPDVRGEELPEPALGVLQGREERRRRGTAGWSERARGAFGWDQVGEPEGGVHADSGGSKKDVMLHLGNCPKGCFHRALGYLELASAPSE